MVDSEGEFSCWRGAEVMSEYSIYFSELWGMGWEICGARKEMVRRITCGERFMGEFGIEEGRERRGTGVVGDWEWELRG